MVCQRHSLFPGAKDGIREERRLSLSGSSFNYPLEIREVRHVGESILRKGLSHVEERAGYELAVIDGGHTIERYQPLSLSQIPSSPRLQKSKFTPSGQKPGSWDVDRFGKPPSGASEANGWPGREAGG